MRQRALAALLMATVEVTMPDKPAVPVEQILAGEKVTSSIWMEARTGATTSTSSNSHYDDTRRKLPGSVRVTLE